MGPDHKSTVIEVLNDHPTSYTVRGENAGSQPHSPGQPTNRGSGPSTGSGNQGAANAGRAGTQVMSGGKASSGSDIGGGGGPETPANADTGDTGGNQPVDPGAEQTWADGPMEAGVTRKASDTIPVGADRTVEFTVQTARGKEGTHLLWHRRLAHPGNDSIAACAKRGKIVGLTESQVRSMGKRMQLCNTCVETRQSRTRFRKKSKSKMKAPNELILIDIVGPFVEIAGFKYFLTIVDAYSRRNWVFMMKSKAEAFEILRAHCGFMERQRGNKVRTIRSDNGGEFTSNEAKAWAKESGIEWQYTTPYTSIQNGIAERMNRTIQEKARAIMHASGVQRTNGKLSDRGLRGMFMGYAEDRKAWMVLTPSHPTKKIHYSRDVRFDEGTRFVDTVLSEKNPLMPSALSYADMLEMEWNDTLIPDIAVIDTEIPQSSQNAQAPIQESLGSDTGWKEVEAPRESTPMAPPTSPSLLDIGMLLSPREFLATPIPDASLEVPSIASTPSPSPVPSLRSPDTPAVPPAPHTGNHQRAGPMTERELRAQKRHFARFKRPQSPGFFALSVSLQETGGSIRIALIYVDDVLIVAPTEAEVAIEKKWLKSTFDVTDGGPLRHFLGLKITREGNKIIMSQRSYIKAVLERFNLSFEKPASTPTVDKVPLRAPADYEPTREMVRIFAAMVGCLKWIAQTMRPDLMFACGVLSRFQARPMPEHMDAAKRLMRFLRKTGDEDLVYQPAEYIALAEGLREGLWLRNLLSELGYPAQQPFELHTDNEGTRSIAENPEAHKRTKHIALHYHAVRERVNQGEIAVVRVNTDDNPADVFTKHLPGSKLLDARLKLHVVALD
ncbi:unnamed protein product [Tilletia caries]|nr:unnamed protein product [Tilletia caries]